MEDGIHLSNWLPLESNIDVLNNYLSVLGINSEFVGFSEVVSLDKETLMYLPQPIVGAIFVYPDSKLINNYFFNAGEGMFLTKPSKPVYIEP